MACCDYNTPCDGEESGNGSNQGSGTGNSESYSATISQSSTTVETVIAEPGGSPIIIDPTTNVILSNSNDNDNGAFTAKAAAGNAVLVMMGFWVGSIVLYVAIG